MVRLAGTAARLPRYVRLAAALARDPAVPTRRKVALAGGVAYAALPIDLVPGFIPLVGQLDDLAALLYGIRSALRGLPAGRAEAHLARAGLSADALDADLGTVATTIRWLGTRAAATALVAGRGAVRISAGAGRSAARLGLAGLRGLAGRRSHRGPVRDGRP